MKTIEKTNVMRLLEAANIPYTGYTYGDGTAIGGEEVAKLLEKSPDAVFKTLVTKGKSGEHYVFVIPVNTELNLKRAASSVNEKSIEMIKQKELLPLTGYVHGGCSPIGMKKTFKTVFHETVILCDKIMFSAGKIGYQTELNPEDLSKIIQYGVADIAE